MATVTWTNLDLTEVAKRLDPSGKQARIAEVLKETNAILDDIPFLPSNDTFTNKTVRRSQEPTGTFRKLNKGISPASSKTTVFWDVIGLLEDEAKNDCEIIDNFPDPAQARIDENSAFISGLGKTMAGKLIYGSTVTAPEEFNGLSVRLNATTDTMVQGAGGSGSDLTSIYVVDWGPNLVHGIYPKNSVAGLSHENLGKQIVQDGSSNDYLAYVDWFKWRVGLAVKDPRAIARVCNIESTGASNIFDEDLLIKVLVQMRRQGQTRIYCNRTVMAQMWIRLKDKGNVHLVRNEGLDAGGMPLTFDGIPIRQVDQILDTESAVS